MARLTPDEQDLRFLRRLLFVALAAALLLFVYKAAHLLLLVFGGMLGAVLLSAVANLLARHARLPRALGLTVAVLLLLTFFGLIGWLFGAETFRQADALRHELPRDWTRLQASWGADPVGRVLLDSGRTLFGGDRFAGVAAGLGIGTVQLLVNFLILLIAAVFFAAQPEQYRRGLVLLLPRPYRAPFGEAFRDVGRALKLWLLTQIISMTLMGVMIAAGLWLSGVEGWGALGLLGGLSEFIPYVGPTLAMVPAIIVALAGGASVWGVLLTYLVVRIVQANLITPLISHAVVSVPAGLYLFLILASGYAFGTFGLFFAGALAVAAYTLTISLYVRETLGEDVAPPGGE